MKPPGADRQFSRALATALHTVRVKQGLTQRELAERAGVRAATVCKAEDDPARLKVETLERLAAALGLTVVFQWRKL